MAASRLSRLPFPSVRFFCPVLPRNLVAISMLIRPQRFHSLCMCFSGHVLLHRHDFQHATLAWRACLGCLVRRSSTPRGPVDRVHALFLISLTLIPQIILVAFSGVGSWAPSSTSRLERLSPRLSLLTPFVSRSLLKPSWHVYPFLFHNARSDLRPYSTHNPPRRAVVFTRLRLGSCLRNTGLSLCVLAVCRLRRLEIHARAYPCFGVWCIYQGWIVGWLNLLGQVAGVASYVPSLLQPVLTFCHCELIPSPPSPFPLASCPLDTLPVHTHVNRTEFGLASMIWSAVLVAKDGNFEITAGMQVRSLSSAASQISNSRQTIDLLCAFVSWTTSLNLPPGSLASLPLCSSSTVSSTVSRPATSPSSPRASSLSTLASLSSSSSFSLP